MEFIAKLTVYVVLGIAVMAVNVWYARAVYRTVSGGDLVIAPVKIVGGSGDSSVLGDALARMVISRIQAIEWDLQQSQISLQQEGVPRTDEATLSAGSPAPGAPRGVTAGILGTPRTAGLNAQLFEPTSIDVKVAGVDVGGLLPRIQRWFVQDRTLAFTVYLQENSAVINGNID